MHGLSDELYVLPIPEELRALHKNHNLTSGQAGRLVASTVAQYGDGRGATVRRRAQNGRSCGYRWGIGLLTRFWRASAPT